MATIEPVRLDDQTPQGEMLREHENRVAGYLNFFGTLANSRAAFNAYLGSVSELRNGVLPTELGIQIALTVSNEIGSPYCINAYKSLAAKHGVSPYESALNASGISTDSKTGLILAFVRKLISEFGRIKRSEIELLRAQRISDEEILEIIVHTVLNMAAGMVNHVAGTELENHDDSA
ncbi:MAG: hypothetical protein AAFN50_09650 [Pseudomonadota bacterium]